MRCAVFQELNVSWIHCPSILLANSFLALLPKHTNLSWRLAYIHVSFAMRWSGRNSVDMSHSHQEEEEMPRRVISGDTQEERTNICALYRVKGQYSARLVLTCLAATLCWPESLPIIGYRTGKEAFHPLVNQSLGCCIYQGCST